MSIAVTTRDDLPLAQNIAVRPGRFRLEGPPPLHHQPHSHPRGGGYDA